MEQAPVYVVTAVLLAAGASRRFGPGDKLLAEVGGIALVSRVARALLDSKAGAVVVVTPPEAGAIAAALIGCHADAALRLSLVSNPDPGRGIASSIATGIHALDAEAAGAMIVPADMPNLDGAHCDRLLSASIAARGDAVVYAATVAGQQRNPVIWPRRLFGALAALQGNIGGKLLIAAERAVRPECVLAVTIDDALALDDVDRPEDLAR